MPFDGSEFHADDLILRVIDRVDELICDEEHWGIGISCRTLPVPEHRDLMREHCPRTAMVEICGEWLADEYFERAVSAITLKYEHETPHKTVAYNNADERTFPEIKALIRKAHELRLADIMETVDV